jgi:hypothetical protein
MPAENSLEAWAAFSCKVLDAWVPVDARSELAFSRARLSKSCESLWRASLALAVMTAPLFSRSSCYFARITLVL